MKIKILIGSNYPDKDGKEIRCEARRDRDWETSYSP